MKRAPAALARDQQALRERLLARSRRRRLKAEFADLRDSGPTADARRLRYLIGRYPECALYVRLVWVRENFGPDATQLGASLSRLA